MIRYGKAYYWINETSRTTGFSSPGEITIETRFFKFFKWLIIFEQTMGAHNNLFHHITKKHFEEAKFWIRKGAYKVSLKEGFDPKEWELPVEIQKQMRILHDYAATPKRVIEAIGTSNEATKKLNDKIIWALEYYAGNFDGKEGTHWSGDTFFVENKFGGTSSANGGEVAKELLKELKK